MENNNNLSVDPKFVIEQYRIKTNELQEKALFSLAMVNQLNQQLSEALKDKEAMLNHITELEAELNIYRETETVDEQ